MPAMPKAKPRKVRAGVKAKRKAIVKAYGCAPVEDDMDDFYHSRRHLAKMPCADERGWSDLKYQDEAAGLADDIEKTLRVIRDRDGVKYSNEVAFGFLDCIASDIRYHAGQKAFGRALDKLDEDRDVPYPRGEAAIRRPGAAGARFQSPSIARRLLNGYKIEDIAHHETGHAVVSLAAGGTVRFATIKPSRYALGEVKYGALPWDDESGLISVLAGPFAYRRFSRRSDWRHATDELDEVKKKIFRMHGNGGTIAQKYLAYLEARAAKVVDDLWIDIKAVAKALLERETLTGREIRTVIRDAQRKHGRRDSTEAITA